MVFKAHPELKKLVDQDGPAESGYVSWKYGKVETGLEQSKERNDMIPADKVWHKIGLARKM